MKTWINVDEQLPAPSLDVWATDGEHVEQGFRSHIDEDNNH
ncbi:MAG: hypothetical protein RPV21_14620 [Candidatus Sedimenticola sp. (ex Thyasira tokunagai)]